MPTVNKEETSNDLLVKKILNEEFTIHDDKEDDDSGTQIENLGGT